MSCPHCRAGDLIEIGLVVDDAPLTMHNCPSCEARWWDRDGERVGLGQVIDLVSPR